MSPEVIPQLDVPPPPVKRDPPWGYLEIVLVVATLALAIFLCLTVGIGVTRLLPAFEALSPQQISTNPLFFVPVQIVAYLLTFLVVRLVVVAKSGEPFWRSIHWEMPARERVLVFVLTGVVLAMTVLLLSAFLPFPKSLPMQQYFREPRFAYMMAAFGLLVAPLAEELFFRGLLFPVLVRTMGQLSAVIVTGVSFSLMHQGQLAQAWAPLLVLFGVGVVFTVIRARTNSVAACWIAHVAYNGTLFAIMFFSSRGFREMVR